MKRRLSYLIMVMVIVMIAGCGGKTTPAQEPNKSEPAQETAAPAPEKTETQEAETEETEELVPASIKDKVTFWRVREGKLEGLMGVDDFKEFAEFSESEEAEVLAFDEAKNVFLIQDGSSFYRYDIVQEEVTLLDEGALDARYDAGSIYFFDKDHKEFIIEDWMKGSAVETGNEVENYHLFSEATKIDFPEFHEVQECIKGGDYNTVLEKYSVNVSEKGDIYDFNQHKITNVHLPEPLDAQYVTTEGACMLVEGTTCSIYHFGESVFSEQLSEGHWIPVAVYYDPDTERVGGILFNSDEKAIYKANANGVEALCEDVQDFEVARNNEVLFHMDSNGKGYMNEWIVLAQDLPVAEDVLWVSHSASEPGFIMSDGEVFVIK